MNSIPIAEKYIIENIPFEWIMTSRKYLFDEENVEKIMIEFAKLHVKAALQAAAETASELYGGKQGFILDSYDINQIK